MKPHSIYPTLPTLDECGWTVRQEGKEYFCCEPPTRWYVMIKGTTSFQRRILGLCYEHAVLNGKTYGSRMKRISRNEAEVAMVLES